ncbi:MAG: pantoate--beta-alanine ligase [Pseudomonadota bacterium]
MDIISDKVELREQIAEWRENGDHIALVPTMGSLHDGHLALVEAAREHAERVVATVFVNPTQFSAGEDFDTYPRSLELDRRKLQRANADLLFSPDVETVYPFGADVGTRVVVPVLTDELCGAARPGHFDGVTSVVARLFNIALPDVAVFGQKDYQQLLIIRRMVTDLNLPVEIVAAPTVREADGLAMSSRNQYLSEADRALAPALFAQLQQIAHALETGAEDYAALEAGAVEALREAGFGPEYVSIRRAETLELPDRDTDELVVLAAAKLGGARLIDNVLVHV